MISELLLAHVAMGSVAVLAGTTALFAPKGAGWHRAAGTLFVLAMIVAAAAGAVIAALKAQPITLMVGIFTCYLVATSWATVARPSNGRGAIDLAAAVVAAGVGFAGLALGFAALSAGAADALGAEPYFFFGGLGFLAAAGDAAVAVRGGIAGAQRIARHLWRMTFALFIAAGSFFSGPGAVVFPTEWRGSPLLAAPEMIVLALMLFWLVYVFVAKRFR